MRGTAGLVHGVKTGGAVGACPVKGCRAHSSDSPDPSDADAVCRIAAVWKTKLAVLLFAQRHIKMHLSTC